MKPRYVEHDGGRLGFAPNEKLDCTVRALAIASGAEYGRVHALLESYGRKRGRKMKDFARAMRVLCGGTFNGRCPRVAGDTGITLGRYALAHPEGRYCLRVRGHVVAVIDGVIYDLGEPKLRAIVTNAWKFEEVSNG